MKIAIPTMDGKSISQHFGRCKAFLVFDVQGGAIQSRELRNNDHGCSGHGGDPQGHDHSHGGFVQLLGDCQSVIAKGIGGGAMQALRSAGLQVCTVQEDCTPEDAALRHVSGTLDESLGSACVCHDHH
jgi:predicted Fe-Mo cluster-binding NifX family protein